jgi:hypothetical protein
MKISKASWMILAAGVFIIILAGLGMTRSGQINELDALSANLTFTSSRLNNQQTGSLQTEINEYSEQLKDVREQADDIKKKLNQTVLSVDVADKFFEIADFCGVAVSGISTTTIATENFGDIPCERIALSASVTGGMDKVTAFVIALNDNYTTGFVSTAGFAFTEESSSSASFQMMVYARKE